LPLLDSERHALEERRIAEDFDAARIWLGSPQPLRIVYGLVAYEGGGARVKQRRARRAFCHQRRSHNLFS
jgi:hypothetical protein